MLGALFPYQLFEMHGGNPERRLTEEYEEMHIFSMKPPARFLCIAAMALALTASACQTATNTNTNTNSTANTNASPSANTNASASPAPGAAIEAREPDKYQAKLSLKAQTAGSGQNIAIPALTADVARSGDNHRVAFVLPGGEQVIYLDRADKRYIILPKRKQYAELTPQSTGFEVPRMMTPGEIVNQLKNLQGYERVGEETSNGRAAIRYRYAGTTKTETQAGDVKTEAFVLIDKETGLPLHSEIDSQAQGGNVKGISGLKVITEMTDIKTDADAALFEVPAGMNKVSDQQVRQNVDAVGQAVVAILGEILNAGKNANASASPAASASPSAAR